MSLRSSKSARSARRTGAFAAGALAVAVAASTPPRAPVFALPAPPLAAARVDDLYVFSVNDPTRVALAITVGDPFARGVAPASFDPRVLYAIHIDNVGDDRDHLTMQFLADASSPLGTRQRIIAYGPGLPVAKGDVTPLLQTRLGGAAYNQTTNLDKGSRLFAGPRRDPFFFDGVQFARIRAGTARCFRPAPQAANAYANDDVLAIVVEVPKTLIAPRNRGRINVWATASIADGGTNGATFVQSDRIGRPVVRALAEPGADRDASRDGEPADDATFARDVRSFALAPPPGGANRSPQTADALVRVFAPDELQADIEAPNPAAYLGIEAPATPLPTPTPSATPTLAGATPSPAPQSKPRPTPIPTPFRPFGGRTLADPVAAITLRSAYGDLMAKAGLAPDDGRATPCLASDGTTAPKNLSADDFPYLDAPL